MMQDSLLLFGLLHHLVVVLCLDIPGLTKGTNFSEHYLLFYIFRV